MGKIKEELINNIRTHFSVGAIIINDSGELLMIDRLNPPFGFACPAGHIDEDEDPLIAVIREVKEETGLTIISQKELSISDYRDDAPKEPCSRGVINHIWRLYEIKVAGDFIVKHDEVKSIGWYSVDKVRLLKLELIWRYWLMKLNII